MASPAAPTLAPGANIAAFNVGNALGARLGGLAITAGGGGTSPLWAGAGLTAGALGVMIVAEGMRRRLGRMSDPVVELNSRPPHIHEAV